MERITKGLGLQQYDGLSDPKEFVKMFQVQSAMFNWDATMQATVFPHFLKGKAERIYEAIETGKKSAIADVIKAIVVNSLFNIAVQKS